MPEKTYANVAERMRAYRARKAAAKKAGVTVTPTAKQPTVTVQRAIAVADDIQRKKLQTDFLSHIAAAKQKVGNIQRAWDAPFKPVEVRNCKGIFDQISPTINSVFEEFLKLIAPDGYEIIPGKPGCWTVQELYDDPQEELPELVEEPSPADRVKADQEAHAASMKRARAESDARHAAAAAAALKPVDPKKELKKRYRSVTRASKFYGGMFEELEAVDGKYTSLLELYPNGKDAFPWTPPTRPYNLPATEEEFREEWQKATEDLDALLIELKAVNEEETNELPPL